MSVVNKMLQDLEARKEQSQPSADYQAPTKRKPVPWALLLVILFVILAAAIALFVKQAKVTTGIAERPVDSVAVLPEQPAPSNPQPQAEQTSDQANAEQASEQANEQINQLSSASDSPPTDLSTVSFTQRSPVASQPASSDIDDREVAAQSIGKSTFPEPESSATKSTMSNAEAKQILALPEAAPIAELSKQVSNEDATPGSGTTIQDEATQSSVGSPQVSVKSTQQVDTEAGLKQQIQIALKRSDDSAAIALLQRLVALNPDNLPARKRLAAMLFAQGKHDQASAYLQQGIELQPNNHELRLMHARLYVQLNNPEYAHDLLKGYTVNTLQAIDFISFRAALAQQVARFDDAQDDYLLLTRAQPANAKWWLGLAIAQERLSKQASALQAYKTVSQLSQLSPEVEKFVSQRIEYLAGKN